MHSSLTSASKIIYLTYANGLTTMSCNIHRGRLWSLTTEIVHTEVGGGGQSETIFLSTVKCERKFLDCAKDTEIRPCPVVHIVALGIFTQNGVQNCVIVCFISLTIKTF